MESADRALVGDSYCMIRKFVEVCSRGCLEDVVRVAEELNLTRETNRANLNLALRVACMCGHLNVAGWLMRKFELTRDDVRGQNHLTLWSICLKGRLEIAQWLVYEFGLDPADVRLSHSGDLLMLVCRRGQLALAIWLTEWLRLTVEDVRLHKTLAQAFRSGHLGTVRWLVERFGLTAEDGRTACDPGLKEACKRGHLEVALWVLDWVELGPEERAGVLSQIPGASPAVESLLTGWERPPGPGDKPALG